jgi:hypothetical protein
MLNKVVLFYSKKREGKEESQRRLVQKEEHV